MKKPKRLHPNFEKHYGIPENYFTRLEDRMLEQIPSAPVRRVFWQKWVWRVAAVLLLGWIAWPWIGHHNAINNSTIQIPPDTVNQITAGLNENEHHQTTEPDLSDIPDELIDEYLLIDDDPLSF